IPAKTPTYRYLTIDGKIPEVAVPQEDFPDGTLVRHIGYNAADLFHTVGESSLYGLLMRSLAEPLFPVWFEMYALQPGKAQGYPTFRGYRRYGRLIRGTVNALERAFKLGGAKTEYDGDDGEDATATEDASKAPPAPSKILHRASEYYQLPEWDYGG